MTIREETSFHGTPRFRVLHPLGAGGAGTVYAALDREAGCVVALKVLRDTNPETLLLLKEEFRGVADIHHPNLVGLRELVEESGRWFVSMDLIDGVDVLSYLRPAGPDGEAALDEARLRDVIPQLLLGVAALHRAGKVHCDVSPSNVVVTSEARAVLLDFGIIRDAEQRLPREHGVAGTPEYMSPEQVLGERVGPAADVYGIGAILYTALTGHPPFRGTVQEIFEAKVSLAPPRPSALAPGVPGDLDAVCVALLDADPARRPSVEEALALLGKKPAASIAPPREVFVGRARELAALDAALDDTRKGSPVIVVLEGESGIGKTYLAREFVRRAGRADAELLVLQGKCYEQESVPYKGFDGIVDDLTHVLTALPEEDADALLPAAVALLRPLFPVIDRVPAVARASFVQLDASPQGRRREAVAMLREVLTRVARRFHAVLQIEDFHWANADTLQLLFDLLTPPDAPALLVLITQRASAVRAPAKRARGWRTLPGDVRVVEVATFSPEDTRELVERLMEGSSDTASASQLVQTAARETNGHPLFIHELVVERGTTMEAGVPMRLDEALASRVRGLPPESRAVVETVCLAGLPLSQELLAASQGTDVGALALLLPSLRAHHLVRGSGTRRTDVIEPYHDRVRESVARQLSPERRREVHRWLAMALERQAGSPADVLAFHWEGAGEATRARDALVRAGDAASSAYAFDYAADLYGRALALALDEGESRRSLLERLGDALRNGGRGREASEAYDRAAALAAGSLTLDLRRRAAEQLLTSGQFDEGRAAFRRVLDQEGIRIAWSPWTSVFLGIVRRVWLLVRGLGFRERPESEVDPRLLREMEVLFDVLRGLSFLDASLLFDLTIRLALLALRAGEPTRLGRYLCIEAMSAAAGGDTARAQQLLAIAEPLTQRAGDPHTLGVQVMGHALLDFYSNRWASMIDRAAVTASLFRQSGGGVAWETAVVQQFALISMFRAGQLRRLRESSREFFDDAERRGDQFGMTSYGIGHPTLVHLVSDTPAAGRELVRTIMQRWTREAFLYQHYNAFLYEVTADLYEGDATAAWGRIKGTWSTMSRACLLFFPEIAHEAYHLRGRVALARARELPRASSLRAALVRTARADARRLQGRRLPWPRANGELVAAGVAAIGEDRALAKRHLEAAIRLFDDETRMPLYAAAARRQLGALVGGDEGEALEAAADAAFRDEGVVRPDRFAGALVGTFAAK